MSKNKNDALWWHGGLLPLRFAYAPSEKAWRKALKAISVDPEPYPTSHARCSIFYGTAYPETVAIVTLNPTENATEAQIVGLIVHEAMHCVQYLTRGMFPYVDGPVRLDDETEAYAVQYITQQIYDAYKSLHHPKMAPINGGT